MVKEVAPNLSYHYWYLGVRGIELDEDGYQYIFSGF